MDFDEMMNLPWKLSTAEVSTPPVLIECGQPEKFVVRMATANEMTKASNIQAGLDKVKALYTALQSVGVVAPAQGMMEWMGLEGDAPTEEHIRRIEYVLLCTTSPVLTRHQVIWLGRFQSYFFRSLFEQIMLLSYEGAKLGESTPSTEFPESETPSLSAA